MTHFGFLIEEVYLHDTGVVSVAMIERRVLQVQAKVQVLEYNMSVQQGDGVVQVIDCKDGM
jgi:hypothetical protein